MRPRDLRAYARTTTARLIAGGLLMTLLASIGGRWLAGRGRGGQHHGIWVWLLPGSEGSGKPGTGERHRLRRQGIGQQVVVKFHARYVIRDAAALQSCFAADKS